MPLGLEMLKLSEKFGWKISLVALLTEHRYQKYDKGPK